jgi:hypothetical protein
MESCIEWGKQSTIETQYCGTGLIHPSGMYITLAIEPRLCDWDVGFNWCPDTRKRGSVAKVSTFWKGVLMCIRPTIQTMSNRVSVTFYFYNLLVSVTDKNQYTQIGWQNVQ